MKTDNGQERHQQQGHEYGHVHQVQQREHHSHERYSNGHALHNENHSQHQKQHGRSESETTIFIDLKSYHIKDSHVTAAELRKISVPPIGDDQDIYHVVAGSGEVKMRDNDIIDVNMHEKNHGRHFISAMRPSRQEQLEQAAYFIYLERGCQHGFDVNDWLAAESQCKDENLNVTTP